MRTKHNSRQNVTHTLSIRFAPSTAAVIARLADADRRSFGEMVRILVDLGLDQMLSSGKRSVLPDSSGQAQEQTLAALTEGGN